MNREELLAKLKELYNIYDYIAYSDTTTVEASKVRDDIDELIVMLTPRTRAEIMDAIEAWCEKEEYKLFVSIIGIVIRRPADQVEIQSYADCFDGIFSDIPNNIVKLLLEYWEAVE